MERTAEVLLTKAVAQLLHLSEVTIRTWEKQGKLRAKHASGGVRLFDAEEIQALARKLEVQRQKSRK